MSSDETPDGSKSSGPASGGVELELERGTAVERYVVLEKVGRGGMGVVYSAYDSRLDRKVALKLLRGAGGPEHRARLLVEGQTLARLKHPSIVTVHDVVTFRDGICIAMEFIDGGTLTQWLGRERRGWEAVVRVFIAAGEGLAAAHAAGFVHRDFKPDNVLIDATSEKPSVTDFGLAADEAGLRVGTLAGTPGFMAPEQARRETVDARADQFSFCASLHLALYGKLPFPKAHDPARPLPLLESAPPGSPVPAWLRRVVFKGLAEDPNARYGSMGELLAALRDDPARRRQARLLLGVSLFSVAALMGLGVLLVGRETDVDRARRQCVEHADGAAKVIWGPARRAEIEGAFRGLGGGDKWAHIDERLTHEVRDWTLASKDACQLSATDPERRRWVACLDERRKTLQSLSDVFAAADRSVVGDAVNTVLLEAVPVGSCKTTREDEATTKVDSAADERMRAALARARVLKAAGKYADAVSQALDVLDEAKDSIAPQLAAEANLLVGDLYVEQQRPSDAEPYLRDAITGADTLASDELRARAWITLLSACVDIACRDQQFVKDQANAILERMGRPPLLEAARLNAEGAAALKQGDNANAETAFKRSLELRKGQLPADHPLVARSLNNLALALHDRRRVPVLMTVVAMRERVFGNLHPETAQALHNLGDALVQLGECPEGRARIERALEIWQQVPNVDGVRVSRERASLGLALECLSLSTAAAEELRAAAKGLQGSAGARDDYILALTALARVMKTAGTPAGDIAEVQAEIARVRR